MDITVGIDMATEQAGRGACIIEWHADGPDVTIVDRGNARLDLSTVSRLARSLTDLKQTPGVERFLVGIDVPFGWPSTFVSALGRAAGSGAPRAGASFEGAWEMEDRNKLCARQTDLIVEEVLGGSPRGAPRPLRVAADRIGATAMAMRALELELAGMDFEFDRSGGPTSDVAEVYPAASLFAWDIPAKGYKTTVDFESKREAIFEGLTAALGEEKQRGLRAKLKRSLTTKSRDHDLDAFICALTARVVQQGRTYHPGRSDVTEARKDLELDETASLIDIAKDEGWIHAPSGPETLAALWRPQ